VGFVAACLGVFALLAAAITWATSGRVGPDAGPRAVPAWAGLPRHRL